jgi:hypothetical protein
VRERDILQPRTAGQEEHGGERVGELAVLALADIAPAAQDLLHARGRVLQRLPPEQVAEHERPRQIPGPDDLSHSAKRLGKDCQPLGRELPLPQRRSKAASLAVTSRSQTLAGQAQ